MIFDKRNKCDKCIVGPYCVKQQKIDEFEDLINRAEIYNTNTGDSWPLTYYLNDPDFEKMLPIRVRCDCFAPKKETDYV